MSSLILKSETSLWYMLECIIMSSYLSGFFFLTFLGLNMGLRFSLRFHLLSQARSLTYLLLFRLFNVSYKIKE